MDFLGKLNIKDKIEEIVEKVKNDDGLKADFKKDPVKAVEKLLGVDLPDETIQKVVEGVKAKLDFDKLGGMLGGILGKK